MKQKIHVCTGKLIIQLDSIHQKTKNLNFDAYFLQNNYFFQFVKTRLYIWHPVSNFIQRPRNELCTMHAIYILLVSTRDRRKPKTRTLKMKPDKPDPNFCKKVKPDQTWTQSSNPWLLEVFKITKKWQNLSKNDQLSVKYCR